MVLIRTRQFNSPHTTIILLFLSKKKVVLKDIIPNDYVDIHSHLLPGIDDGTKTIYQSAYILEQFERLGIKKAITTPHVISEVWPNSSQIIINTLDELQKALPVLGINVVEIQAGAEYMMDDLFFQRVKDKDILPMHDNYILVEMSSFGPPMNLNEILFEIKLAGYVPVLAHPERYIFYENDLKKFEDLKELGFLFQLNLLSLSSFYGDKIKSFAQKMLQQNYFDFVGSDIHNYHQLDVLEQGFHSKTAQLVNTLMKKNNVFS